MPPIEAQIELEYMDENELVKTNSVTFFLLRSLNQPLEVKELFFPDFFDPDETKLVFEAQSGQVPESETVCALRYDTMIITGRLTFTGNSVFECEEPLA